MFPTYLVGIGLTTGQVCGIVGLKRSACGERKAVLRVLCVGNNRLTLDARRLRRLKLPSRARRQCRSKRARCIRRAHSSAQTWGYALTHASTRCHTMIAMVLATSIAACHPRSAVRDAQPTPNTVRDTRDGHVYRTVTIGERVWFAENLAYMPHVAPIAQPGGIWVYGFDGTSVTSARNTPEYHAFGNLYDWETALHSCPVGWQVPSEEEWRALEITLGMTTAQAEQNSWRGTDQGTRLKSGGDTGFDVQLAGWRSGEGRAAFRDEHANFWTSTSFDHRAYERLFNVRRPTIGRDVGNKTAAFSVRCIKQR